MQVRSLSHLADHVLLQALRALVVKDRAVTVELLIHLAEVDERKLYLPAAQPSMFWYCVNELRMSESAAMKRIQVARKSREFPALLDALANGRLHLTAIEMLAPHLKPENAASRILAASHRTKSELQHLIAEWEPKKDVATSLRPLPAAGLAGPPVSDPASAVSHSPAHVDFIGISSDSGASPPIAIRSPDAQATRAEAATGVVAMPEPGTAAPGQLTEPEQRFGGSAGPAAGAMHAASSCPTPPAPAPPTSQSARRPHLAPLSPGRYELRCTLSREAHDKLRLAQSLLGHAIPSGDLTQVLERAIDALVDKLERPRIAAPARVKPRRGKPGSRYIPAAIRRAVEQRDSGRCTYVGAHGKRCPACTKLEFDHVKPVAKGGETTVANLRLRCRAHNQYEADQAFGAGFMKGKRAKKASRRIGDAGQAASRSVATSAIADSRTPGVENTAARSAGP